MGRKLGVRQALVEGERDRLLLSCFQSFDAAFDRERVRARQQHLHRTGAVVGEHHSWFLIVDGHRVDLPSAHLIETAVAHDTRHPRQRLALCGDVRSRVMPDVDEALLQHLLGGT